MRPETSSGTSCRKSGVILTCYVDGHKWFRSMPLAEGATEEDPGNTDHDAVAEAGDSSRCFAPLRRNRRSH